MIQKKKLKKFKSDKLREECGIFGVSNHEDASAEAGANEEDEEDDEANAEDDLRELEAEEEEGEEEEQLGFTLKLRSGHGNSWTLMLQ